MSRPHSRDIPEDDPSQFDHPDSEGGANVVSPDVARLNFAAVGVSEP
jgi:hypothetical protein